jgi:hypothetical protein
MIDSTTDLQQQMEQQSIPAPSIESICACTGLLPAMTSMENGSELLTDEQITSKENLGEQYPAKI